MLRCVAALLFTSLLATFAAADEIELTDGRTLQGEIVEYANDALRFRTTGGDQSVVAMDLVTRIAFDRPEPLDDKTVSVPPPEPYEKELEALVERAAQQLEGSTDNRAAIVLYLETPPDGQPITNGFVDFRCYQRAGYSGMHRAPLGAAWFHTERIHGPTDNGVRRVQIDPGPPYEVFNRSVTLEPGKVTNLGRIVLKQVQADAEVTISGYVRESNGEPVEGVLVSSGVRRARTDADGFYELTGFGLEIADLVTRKKGYVATSARISIRDTKETAIAQDFTVNRPRRLKLSYVVSAEGSSSFEGPGVEEGQIERVVESSRLPLDETIHSSASFNRFARDTHLYLSTRGGKLTIDNSHAPIFYQQASSDVRFDEIGEAGELGVNQQRCPPLTEGAVIVVRGFREGPGRGVTPFCVKFLVEELSEETGEFDEGEFSPVGEE